MTTKIVTANSLQKGNYVLMEGAACRVTSVQISKPGKHGHSKVRFEGMGLVDDKKRVAVLPGHENVEVPIIEKKTAQVLSISGSKASVMDMDSYETFEMEIPEEVKEQVTEGCTVLYWVVLDARVMKQLKP
ncbi:MAG: translation initiation factor IF-5A [Candidatus Woesearchaeota archaeon]|nr:translation initiation factor IF-5A [Candidatus Woesearchaeota archaeon]